MKTKSDIRLFLSLCGWALLPAIYMLVRMQFIRTADVNINILGQMEWFDLIDETLVTTFITPLYSLLKPSKSSKEKNGTAFLLSFTTYALFTTILALRVNSIVAYMQAEHASEYLLLQSFVMLVSYVSTFAVVLLTVNDDHRTVWGLTLIKLALLVLCDYILIKSAGETGAAYSELITNIIISIMAAGAVLWRRYITFVKRDYSWIPEYFKVGAPAGLQIFLDNIVYALMICKMVNAVAQSGNYWVANNFIWGWLLVPISCMSEVIKKNTLQNLSWKNTWRFAAGTTLLWLITVPAWKWFIDGPMASDSGEILRIVVPLMPFYLAYMVSAFIDAWLISRGRTICMAVNSIFCNIVYYGILYVLYRNSIITMSMHTIIYMFGWGMVVHTALSIAFYALELISDKETGLFGLQERCGHL